MVAYSYVSDKNELVDLVGRKLLSRVAVPPPESGPWDERLRNVLKGIDANFIVIPASRGSC